MLALAQPVLAIAARLHPTVRQALSARTVARARRVVWPVPFGDGVGFYFESDTMANQRRVDIRR